ncbi:MAG: protein translocase subunit SecF, partial [Acidobacteria bacterium]
SAFEGTVAGVEGEDVIIRVALQEKGPAAGETGKDLVTRVLDALRGEEVRKRLAEGALDLNTVDELTLESHLADRAGMDEASAASAAEAIVRWRREHGGVIPSVDTLGEIEGVPEEAKKFLEEAAFTGPFGLRGQDFIEASVSAEMRRAALVAVLGALGGMLVYIWIRFRFAWGLAAIVALAHDTIVTLGAFSFSGMEANLPVVAAFLTLVGYSVNDTIVVFDRVRENIGDRTPARLAPVINESLNQTLSRTLITSLTTWLVVVALFLLGGPVIRPFAFVLLVGIVVGTYSSIYVASPILLIWKRLFGKKPAADVSGGAAKRKKAVRGAS